MAGKPKKRPRKVSDAPDQKRNSEFRGRITVRKRKPLTARTNTDNHWCSFSSLESAERREETDADVALLLLDRLVFVKYLE